MKKYEKLELIDVGSFIRTEPVGNSVTGGVLLLAQAWRKDKPTKIIDIVLEVDVDIYLDCMNKAKNTSKKVFITYRLRDNWKRFKDMFDNDHTYLMIDSKRIFLMVHSQDKCATI
jgi:hypothetical protein